MCRIFWRKCHRFNLESRRVMNLVKKTIIRIQVNTYFSFCVVGSSKIPCWKNSSLEPFWLRRAFSRHLVFRCSFMVTDLTERWQLPAFESVCKDDILFWEKKYLKIKFNQKLYFMVLSAGTFVTLSYLFLKGKLRERLNLMWNLKTSFACYSQILEKSTIRLLFRWIQAPWM